MDHHQGRLRRFGTAAAIGSAGLVTGALVFGTVSATAADSTTTPGVSATSSPAAAPGPGGASPVRSHEKSVTSSQTAALTAAAEKAVPGATVIRVETDAGDAAYEAHVRKADGAVVTVTFDQNLAVTGVESGMGQGDPQTGGPAGSGPGGPGAPAGGAASAAPSSTA
jgi:hypothetical protein